VVDDERLIREGLEMALHDDYMVTCFESAEAAIEELEQKCPDLLLLDIGLPGMSGVDALGRIKELHPDILAIMVTAYEDVDSVISSMKLGASDYVVKPINVDGLKGTIKNTLETVRLKKEVQILQENQLSKNVPCFIGNSDSIKSVMQFLGMVAKSPDTPILILGETGTGKEMIAHAIHYKSPNFEGPFVSVNCAAIPKELIESELFGYEKGAFSGAKSSGKKGLVEKAQNGTLFMDEIGDLSPEAQSKLLRFLEEGEFYRIGGTKVCNVKTRVVSATNKDIETMVENGSFRADLFFRLGVIKLEVPSLGERKKDIIPFAEYFIIKFNEKFGKKITGISPAAQKELCEHVWKGNVRELKNVVERGVLIAKGPALEKEDIGLHDANGGKVNSAKKRESLFPAIPPEGIDLPHMEKSLEKFYIEEALKMSGGNESKAAKRLKLNHHTFRYRRKKYLPIA
jgi:DNA-binding NtrC family response regulator